MVDDSELDVLAVMLEWTRDFTLRPACGNSINGQPCIIEGFGQRESDTTKEWVSAASPRSGLSGRS